MRWTMLAWMGLAACSDPYVAAQQADTVEAYETFLKENPQSPQVLTAEIRLEELMLNDAIASQKLEDFDAVLARFPSGRQKDKVIEERRQALYNWADMTDTPDAWQKFLDEYPSGDRKLKASARQRKKMAEYRDQIVIGPAEMEQVNLAEDPEGPLNGWGFYADVTLKTDRPVTTLSVRISYLDDGGGVLDHDDWPVVAEHLPGYLPFEEGFDKPMAPGETRRWEWTTGDMPAGWSKKVSLKPVDIVFVGEDK